MRSGRIKACSRVHRRREKTFKGGTRISRTLVICFFTLALLIATQLLSLPQAAGVEPQKKLTLENDLNSGGIPNLNSDSSGTLDPKAPQSLTDKKEQKRLLRSALRTAPVLPKYPALVPEDANWDDRFALPGPDHDVFAIAANGNDVYIGGTFSRIGSVAADQIAKWDGAKWSALGDGLTGVVEAIAVSGNSVYAATGNNLYVWDGHTWSVFGGGVAGVSAVVVSGSDLYVGGTFNAAGGVSANGIAKWDGSSWSALGSGMTNRVRTIAVNGSDVYAGGDFITAGGVNANGVARWDETSWHPLGDGVASCPGCHPEVDSIAVSGSDLYVGGDFETAGGISAPGIARWNGTTWSGLSTGVSDFVDSIAISGGDVYVAGAFSTAGGISANNIARWNGSDWFALDGGVTGQTPGSPALIAALALRGNNVYVCGHFDVAGSANAKKLAQWDGSAWSRFGDEVSNGLNAQIVTVAVGGNDVYAGGQFSVGGGLNLNHIAKWNGSNWAPLGAGLNNYAFATAINGSDLYAGGAFTVAGSVNASGIAKWDGNNWSALGSGVNGSVNAIAVSGSDVYVGGFFTTAGGLPANRIAKWNGSSWSAVGNPSSFDQLATVTAIAVNGSDIYVGGMFDHVDGVVVNNIAKWNGSSWSSLGGGVNSGVSAITIDGNDVYVGGRFSQASGVNASLIARWDGNNWSGLGSGLCCCGPDVSFCTPAVYSIVVSNGGLYAAGEFSIAGATAANIANLVARWDGSNWFPLGSGIYPGFDTPDIVTAMALSGSDLYLGGAFQRAGAKPSQNFAHWNDCPISLSPASAAFSADGGNGNVDVTSPGNCAWTINSNTSWVAITSAVPPATSTFSYSVSTNTTNHVRIGSITVGNKTFTIYQAPPLADVPSSNPFYLEISKLYARGISVGCGNGNYCPNDPVTREQMAAFILRAKGEFNPPTPGSQRFNDVSPQNVFYNFIDRLAVLQITLGCTPDHLMYCPSDPVKREQMAAFLLRGLGEFSPPTPPTQRFNDVPPANVFYNFIDRLAVLNITLGCTPDHLMYCPNDSVTRAQMAAFLVRAFNL
jgi:hypothetical protein